KLRNSGEPPIRDGTKNMSEAVERAKHEGFEWVFIDTPPNMSAIVVDAIQAATLIIIPARLTLFDLAAIKETMVVARQLKKPYAVVVNGGPARRDTSEPPFVR